MKSAGVSGLATAVTSATVGQAEAQTGPAVFGPGDVPVSLMVNGKRLDLRIEPRVTLLDAVRNRADLTGNKRVCDRGTCGACTVILNGKAVYACSQLAIDVQRQPIETIESLARPGYLHPLSAAFVEHDAQQCGFCTPGFVMAAKALLDHTPSPTLKDVQHGLSGNFCRCGTYAGMRLAVLAAAGHMDDDEIPIGSGDAAGAKEAAPKGGKGGKAHG